MFHYIHTQNGREIYSINYNNENFEVFYNPKTKDIEQILPIFENGTSTVARLFHDFIQHK